MEARAVDDVGHALAEGPEEHGPVARVVLEVGVLDDDIRRGDLAEPPSQRGALPEVAGLADEANPRLDVGHALDQLGGGVGGAVVDDHDLRHQRRTEDGVERADDPFGLVVTGHHHREARRGLGLDHPHIFADRRGVAGRSHFSQESTG